MAINQTYWLEQFESLSELSDAEILEQIAEGPSQFIERRTSLPGLGEEPPIWQPEPPNEAGKNWFEAWLKTNRQHICGHARLRALIEDDLTTRDLFIVFVDILAALHFAIPVGQVAMLLARGGLKTLCGKPL